MYATAKYIKQDSQALYLMLCPVPGRVSGYFSRARRKAADRGGSAFAHGLFVLWKSVKTDRIS